jgi:hypothetical protein
VETRLRERIVAAGADAIEPLLGVLAPGPVDELEDPERARLQAAAADLLGRLRAKETAGRPLSPRRRSLMARRLADRFALAPAASRGLAFRTG